MIKSKNEVVIEIDPHHVHHQDQEIEDVVEIEVEIEIDQEKNTKIGGRNEIKEKMQ